MSIVIAIANQKGGFGKTTTTVNLGIGLTRHGIKLNAGVIHHWMEWIMKERYFLMKQT